MLCVCALVLSMVVLFAAPARAQVPGAPPPGLPKNNPAQPPPGQPPPGTAPPPATPAPAAGPQTETQISDSIERLSENHIKRIGHVEIHRPGNTSIYADMAEMFQDENRAILTGNVVFSQGDNRITAEHAELNTQTGLGTFYNAYGISTIKPQKPTARPGVMAPPPVTGEDTSVYFFGEVIEKVAPKKYKITKGGFSTCVQPTPRWDLHADTVILNVDHYTLLRNAILNVKGVPMFYLPVMYYPTKKDGRATGFLLPTYGSTSLRGQSFHDAFFWAIDRSQDATVLYDFFSKTGQGVGSEYRYNYGPTSNGNITAHYDDTHDATYVNSDGSSSLIAGSKSYEIRGSANQALPGNMRASANVSYFSSLVNSQTYNTNIYDASRNQRTFGGNLVGAWGGYTMNATVNRSEYFYDANNSSLSGSWPQIDFARNERPLFDTPVYFGVTTQFAHLLRDSHSATTTDATTGALIPIDTDSSLSRVDFFPQLRYPFKKWQWFTVNTTVSWRDTYYSRSQTPIDPTGLTPQTVLDQSINRQFYTIQAQITGPVFNRVFETPESRYAEKFKHTIEPVLNIQSTSTVQDYQQIIQFDGVDNFVGGTTLTYGINNRFYAKRVQTPGQPAQSREILDVSLTQSYYTNSVESQYDRQYQTTGSTLVAPVQYSPIALNIRAVPTNDINATVTAEFDEHYHDLRQISSQATYTWSQRLQTSFGWSKRGYIPNLAGFDDCRTPTPGCTLALPGFPAILDQSITSNTNVHTRDNKVGGLYSFNYDIYSKVLTQQSLSLFYNSQCCGIAMQYQAYNYGANSFVPIPSDHRFFLSFTLAGLGNFSPFNGALAGTPR
jgi:LPS-assembly protein